MENGGSAGSSASVGLIALVAALCVGAMGLAATLRLSESNVEATAVLRTGREWQAIVFLSRSCGACNSPRLPDAVREVLTIVQAHAEAVGDSFSSTGVDLEAGHASGVRFLARFSAFDEVSLGRSWLNHAMIHWAVVDSKVVGGTPSIMLLTRIIEIGGDGGIMVGKDSVAWVLPGLDAILGASEWLGGRVDSSDWLRSIGGTAVTGPVPTGEVFDVLRNY
jgi:hypothetical protein